MSLRIICLHHIDESISILNEQSKRLQLIVVEEIYGKTLMSTKKQSSNVSSSQGRVYSMFCRKREDYARVIFFD